MLPFSTESLRDGDRTGDFGAGSGRDRGARRAERPDADPRHRPRGDVRGERRAGGLLLRPRLRVHRNRLLGARDRPPRPRLARPRAGPHPAGPDGHAHGERRHRRAPRASRRRGPQDRAERPRRGGRLPPRGEPRRPRHPHPALGGGRAGPSPAVLDRDLRRDAAPVRAARGLQGRLPPGLRAPCRGDEEPGRQAAHGDRPHRRQRGARAHGRVGPLLRARLRDDRDDPLL